MLLKSRAFLFLPPKSRLPREQNSTAWRRFSRPKQLSFSRVFSSKGHSMKRPGFFRFEPRLSDKIRHPCKARPEWQRCVGCFIYIHIKTQFLCRPLALTGVAIVWFCFSAGTVCEPGQFELCCEDTYFETIRMCFLSIAP